MLELLFPHGVVAVTAQCVHRPDLIFMLLQNLFPTGPEAGALAGALAKSLADCNLSAEVAVRDMLAGSPVFFYVGVVLSRR